MKDEVLVNYFNLASLIMSIRGSKGYNTYGFYISIFILIIIFLIVKIGIVYHTYKNLSPLNHCLEYFISDIYFLITISLFITISINSKNKIIKIISNTIMLLCIILFYIDMFTIYYFQTQETIFSIIDIIKYGGAGFNGIAIGWIVSLIFTLTITYLCVNHYGLGGEIQKIFTPTKFLIYFFLGLTLYLIQGFIINSLISDTKNILSVNIKGIYDLIYTNKLTTDSNYEDFIEYKTGDGKDLNVILIFSESLSAIDSASLSGNDNTPYLDKILKNGILFTNFMSQGKGSSHCLVSVLLGVLGIEEDYYLGANNFLIGAKEGLPNFLIQQGYDTIFISTASLEFIREREFLKNVGFQKIIGEEEFLNKTHYTRDAAPDKDLYDRVLAEIQTQTGKYFIVLPTISFHTPYDCPYGKTETLCLKYIDEQLYDFYTSLQKIGFFESGILIIVGDHRKRMPIEPGEFDIFGDTRDYRSVATVVGSGINPGTINNNIIQHTDFYFSIKKLLGHNDVAVNMYYNDAFSDLANRDWGITNKFFIKYDGNKYKKYNIESLKEIDSNLYNYYLSQKKLRIEDKYWQKFHNKIKIDYIGKKSLNK